MFKKGELKILKFRQNKDNGFALLFTVIIVSAVSVITAGLTSAIYKQLILSSLAKDSQIAFYQADTASDCALYADLKDVSYTGSTFLADHTSTPWVCGGLNLKVSDSDGNGNYNLLPEFENEDDNSSPCFRIYVTNDGNETTIKARGYNICDLTNKRTVEREIQIIYSNYK